MSDRAAVVLALFAAAGAWASEGVQATQAGRPFPLLAAIVLVVGALALRSPPVLCLGVALATSTLGARSWAGLVPPAVGPWSGTATLAGDPERVSGALRVVVRIGGKRVEAWARGPAARALDPRLSGERVGLVGRLQTVPPDLRARLAPRHLAARLSVERVGQWEPGEPTSRLANGIRRTLMAGAASLPDDRRALFAGFVLGDDRDQSPEVTDDFRASGLAHLLVVSGQNVAFVLALVAPVLGRLGLRTRLAVGLAVLVLFGLLTRWEPSVLRAEAMAALTLLATTLGRPASSLRVLALAVTGLLLVDPLLVRSVGFLLSVGACTGIALLATPLARALPGPRPLASALAVTLAAQAGVVPVLVPVFGPVPVAAIPANLLAAPAAGPLIAWAMAVGLPAGLVGGTFAAVLHLPTELLLAWVAAVARGAASAPLGRLGTAHLAALAAGLGLSALVRRGRGWVVATTSAAVAVLAALPVLAPPPLEGTEVAPGARLWRRGGATVLVVDGTRSATELLDAMHEAGVRVLDVLAVARPGPVAAAATLPLRRRVPTRLVLVPAGTDDAGATVPEVGTSFAVGGVVVRVDAVRPRLQVHVGR
jgi:competence protein ComEC